MARMTYDEWKKKKEEQGQGASVPSATTPPSTTTTNVGTSSGRMTYDEWIEKKNGSALDTWAKSSIGLLNEMQEKSKSWSYKDTHKDYSTRISGLLSQADSWRKQYAGNAEAISHINSVVKALSDTKQNSFRIAESYSKYKTQDEYDTALREQGWWQEYDGKSHGELSTIIGDMEDGEEKEWLAGYASYVDQTEKLGYDLDAGAKELDRLEKTVDSFKGYTEEIDSLSRWYNEYQANPSAATYGMTNSEVQEKLAMYKAFKNRFGSYDAMMSELRNKEDLRNKKIEYLAEAKRLQEADRLASVSDPNAENYDPEFAKYTGYVKGKEALIPDLEDVVYDYVNGGDTNIAVGQAFGRISDDELETLRVTEHMTKDEIRTFNYYYNKEGATSAINYLKSIKESLSHKEAEKQFEAYKDNTALELLFGITAGLDQANSGLRNLFNTEDDYIPASSTQMLSGMIREDLADDSIPLWYNAKTGKWEDKILGSSLGQAGYDAITTTFNMAPSILASTAIGMINPIAGTVTGNALLGASAAGNAYQEKLNLGYTKEQARTYGVMVGTSEAVLQYLLGGISKLGGNVLTDTALKNLDAVDNVFARFAQSTGGKLLLSSTSEAFEEGLQGVIEPYLWQAVSGGEATVDWQESLYNALMGFVTGGMFEGIEVGGNAINTSKQNTATGRSIMDLDGGVNSLMTLADEMAGVTSGKEQQNLMRQTEKVSAKMDKGSTSNRTARQVAKLYNAVKGSYGMQNHADIVQALTKGENGFSTKEANKIAGAMVALSNGLELTEAQANLLESVKNNPAVLGIVESINSNETLIGQRNQQLRDFTRDVNAGAFAKATGMSVETVKALRDGKYTPTEENTPERTYEVSTDGKTLDSKGNDIRIVGIESVEDGKLILKTENGTIDSSEVVYATEAEALIYEAVANLGTSPESAWEMVNGWSESSGITAAVYASNLKLAYTYGKLNYKAGMKSLANMDEVFKMGRADAEASVKATTQASTESTVGDKNADKKIIFEGFTEKEQRAIKGLSKASMAAIDMVNKVTNLEVHVYKSYKKDGKLYAMVNGKERSAPNGYFTDGNKIYIDINAGNAGTGLMLFTMSHEMGHYIAKWNAQDFKAISDFLFEHYGENVPILDMLKYQKEKLKASYKEDGKPIPSEAQLEKEAHEELVCEMLSRMMADKYAYDKLMELKQKDLKLHQKLGQVIKKVLDKIAKAIGIYDTQSPDFKWAASKENFGEEAFRQLQDLYLKAFVQADANFKTAEKNTTEDGGGTVYMSRDIDSVTEDTVRDDLTEIFNGINVTASSYIPLAKTTPFAVRYITGYTEDRPIIVEKKKAYFDMREDGIFEEDSSHHYHGMGIDGFIDAMDILEDPECAIYELKKKGKVHYAFISLNENEEEICVVFQMGVSKSSGQMNGLKGGYYNLDITEFVATDEWLEEHGVEPGTSYKDYLLSFPENRLAYDRKYHLEQLERARAKELEKARIIDSESAGVAASYDNNRASGDKVTQPGTIVKSELEESGIGFDEETKTVFALRDSTAYKDILTVGRKKFDTEAISQLVAKGTGRSIEDARKWVNSELSIANLIMANPEFLDFEPDERYDAIKKNSDYPQGTVDLSNLCPKREEFTAMFDMLQKKYPNKLFTAQDIADMRKILSNAKLTVACGACFVEDRRQLVGEIADTYINMWKEAVETGKPLQKTNASGVKSDLLVTKALAKQYGLTAGSKIMATDTYIPNQYDLTTYEGFKLLEKNHPTIAMGFNRYNNSRGQQSARLIEGRAEYKRQILGWSPAQVRRVNNNGGLRIFSFSDFEVVHLLDLVQVIIDCAAKGVKIQGYTKIPAFAKLVRDTGIKLNRSLIPLGDLGYHIENGKVVLDYDPTEGIDIHDENFIDERDNPNVGNILIGINPTQIGAAMLDSFVDYIIPFHSNKAKAILKKLGTGEWVNYKESQHEKDVSTGTASKHNVNIYTEVIDKYHPTNKVEFVEAFLEECKKQGKIPRYSEFLNKEYKEGGSYQDEYGAFDYTYREGFHKLIVDFKMFDKNGNILPQGNITPKLDEGFMKDLLNAEIDKKQSYEFPKEVYDAIDKKFGEQTTKMSDRDAQAVIDDAINAIQEDHGTESADVLAEMTTDVMNTVKLSDRDTFHREETYSGIGKELLAYEEGDMAPDLTLVETFNERTGKTEVTIKHYGQKPKDYIPKKIAYCYKLFEQHPDGTLHALFAGAKGETPIGVWQYAQGFPYTDAGVKGMNLRERYGWHLSAGLPSAPHLMSPKDFSRGYPSKNSYGHPKGSKRVWVRMAYDASTDFNSVADSTREGDIFGLIPFGGYYAFKENNQSEWVISSAVKIDAILEEDERQQILRDAGFDEYEAWRKKFRATEAEKAESKRKSAENKKAKDKAKKAGLNYLSESAREMRESIKSRIIDNPEVTSSSDGSAKTMYSDRDNAPTFYSQMAKVVDGMKQEKFGASSVISMLRGRGVKSEEIKWSGIEEWLEGKKSVTKAELQEFIAGSMLQIEEETLTNEEIPYTEEQQKKLDEYTAKRDEIAQMLADEWKEITGDEFPIRNVGYDIESTVVRKIIDVNKEHKDAAFEGRLLKKLKNDLKEVIANNDDFGYDDWRDALRAIHRHRRDFISHYEMSTNDKAIIVKYCNALNAYNELANRISEADADKLRIFANEVEVFNRKIGAVKSEHYSENAKHMTKWGSYKLKGGENYREILFKMPGSSYYNDAMAMHWEDRDGVLVHARIQDLNTFLGKMLFVEELQSDWHNEGHKTEYRDVPDAPFKDTYHEYVMKRLLRMAAEQDYDSIGWTTAQTQVERWSEKFAEGYRIEYDQDIPKFLNKYGKKWGTKVGKTTLDNGTEVWSMAITDSMKDSVLTEGQALYQDRVEDSVSNRSLLANAFEGMAQNDIERNKIQEYKSKISLINAEEKKLRELNAQIKELSFAKGPKDTKKLKELRFDANQAANRVNTYDKQLLRLEASQPLQDVLAREKKRAYAKAAQRGREALAEYKDKVEAQQKEIAEKWRKSRKAAVAKARETAEKRDAREKLQKLVLDTVKWITYPTKTDVKCPDILKKPYADFLNGIDLSSKRLANGGDPTKNDLRLANAMDSLATALDRIMTAQDPTQETDKVLDTGYLDLPANFVKQLRDMNEDIKAMMVDGDYVVNTMTASEVRKLSQMIRTLNHAIKTMSNLYANLRFANVEALGFDTMEFMDALGEIEKTGGMKDFVQWDNALPYYAFKRFGKGGESVFEGLMDAQDKLAFLAQVIFDFQEKTWTGAEAKAWSEDTHTITLPNGNELTLTTADAMSIYCLSRREQGLQHLLGGGTRVIGLQKGSTKAKDSRSLLTIKDIDAINSSLTDRQKQVAEGVQEFMSTVCSEWGNEISMKRFLTKEFTEKFYFPIESNDENLTVKDPAAQQSDLFRLLNISATKPLTPGANNEVIIRNIFDVFTGHASDMARLNAFGMGLLDYMKWLNYREKGVNEEGQVNVKGVRKSMEKAYGKAANSYVLNLVKDVNGRASDGGDPTILMRWMRAGKTASVGSSLRVATLQITSYPRAALVLSPKSLALGLSKLPNINKAKKYCGIALWKSFGFYDTNISRSIEDQMKGVKDVKQKLIELSLKGAEWGDAITWGALWNACEYEVAATKEFKVGTEEFYQAVGKKLREVVYRTQVVDSTLTRSQMMRSKRGMAQEASAFMSEPTLSANILMDAGFEFNAEKRRTGSAKAAWAKTGGYIGRAVAVYFIGQLAAALLEGLWDAWRDDEDEEFGEKFLSAFVENLALDLVPFNKIPIVSDVFEAALAMFGVGFYSSDKMSTTWLTQAVSAVDAWKDVLSGNSSTTAYNALYKSVRAVSSFVGVSISGVMREGVALWNNTAGAYDSTLKIRQWDLSKADLGGELYEAIISGNTRQADSLRGEFADEEAYQSALRTAIRGRFESGEIDYDTALQYLVDYGGVEDDDAYWKVEEWKFEDETGEDFGKYDDFFAAVETGKNLNAVIKEYTDNGVTASTLAKQISEHFKSGYMEMTKSERSNIKGYLLNAYTALGYDREDAMETIGEWEYQADCPDLVGRITYTQYKRWQTDGKPNGVSIELFTKVAEYRDNDTSDSDRSQEDVAMYINSLPISTTQKDALWCCFWKESTLKNAPWH